MKTLSLFLLSGLCALQRVDPAMAGEATVAPRYRVEVNGAALPVLHALVFVGSPACFAQFELHGETSVHVRHNRALTNVVIRPLAAGIKPLVSGSDIRFTVRVPCFLSVEPEGAIEQPLFLFVNPPETGVPDANAPEVIYFGPGVHEVTTIDVPRDKSVLYLAPGALLRCELSPGETPLIEKDWASQKVYRELIHVRDREQFSIRGRGVIDMGHLPWHARGAIKLSNCRNASVEGLTIIDSPHWTVVASGCSNILVRGIKQIAHRENSDGINIVSSRKVLVEDCFLRVGDDGVCVKSSPSGELKAAQDIEVRRCVIWNDRTRALGVNGENSAPIRDVIFRDCDIVHDTCQWEPVAALACMLERSAPVERILFEDIRCEDIARNFIHLSIQSGTQFSGGEGPGHLRNVTFRRVSYLGTNQPLTRISGYSADHLVEDVTFEQMRFGGREARSESALNVRRNEFVRGVHFIAPSRPAKPEE